MELFLYFLGTALGGVVVGSITTTYYHEKAIGLYKEVTSGKYTMMLVNSQNPRLLDAAMILAQGKIEMAVDELPEPPKPRLEVVKDE